MAFEKTVGSRAEVLHGTAAKTSGGLVKKDLIMKDGRIHSKAMVKRGKNDALVKWRKAVAKARKELKTEGFVPLSKDSELYKLAKKHYNKM